jgi:hypothetical protein
VGTRGPIPKRDDQRRRQNVPVGGPAEKGEHVPCDPPKANPKWHPVAKRWYLSLAQSGQSWWYQASDWATAELLAEEMSRCLRPQYVGYNEVTGDAIYADRPLGNSLAAILKGAGVLMATEGDRRRLRIELERKDTATTEGTISWIDQARRSG